MKCQDLFSPKRKKRNRMLPATILLGTLRVTHLLYFTLMLSIVSKDFSRKHFEILRTYYTLTHLCLASHKGT